MVFKKSGLGLEKGFLGLGLTGLGLEKIGGLRLVIYAAFIHAGLTTRYRKKSL